MAEQKPLSSTCDSDSASLKASKQALCIRPEPEHPLWFCALREGKECMKHTDLYVCYVMLFTVEWTFLNKAPHSDI